MSAPAVEPARLFEGLGSELSPEIVTIALTHRSFSYENGGVPTNERLEFLGDTVLGLVVTDVLFTRFPELAEGQLAKMRASMVNMRALAGVARTIGLGAHLRLGRGEETSGGRDKSSILADTLEALFGAVYVEHGMEKARGVVLGLMSPLLASAATTGAGLDWKTNLQEFTANEALGVPEYAISEEGPDHAKTFHAQVLVGGKVWGEGSGRSKKEAEQGAASVAHAALSAEAARLAEAAAEIPAPED